MTDLDDQIPDDRTLGTHLHATRADRNLTRRAAANDIGVPLPTYREWERDRQTPTWTRTREALADWLSSDDASRQQSGGRVRPEHSHEAATPLGLLGVRQLDRVALTLRYRLPGDSETHMLRFAGDASEVIDSPSWYDLDVPDGTAYYLRPDTGPLSELLIVVDGENRLLDVEIGPDGDRQPVVAVAFEEFARSGSSVPHPSEVVGVCSDAPPMI